MEVDPPPLSGSQPDITSDLPPLNPLKRSNSAPMINVLGTDSVVVSSSSSPITVSLNNTISSHHQQPVPPTTASYSFSIQQHQPSLTFCNTFPRQYERIRRYSTSSTNLHSASTPVKVAPQLDRIKREESSNPKEREEAHEHKMQSHIQLSSSWESLNLTDDAHPLQNASGGGAGEPRRPKSFGEPLHIFTSPYPYASSPSPTRNLKQCFSPSLQQPVRTLAGNMTPSPSPSPTRKSFVRRSMSPIALRPSPLGASLKRKMECESDRMDCYSSPKRLHMTYSPVSAAATTTTTSDRQSSCFSHPLMQSVSSSDDCNMSHNGMLPPSALNLPDSTSTALASSTASSFTCRSPLVFCSSSSSSSPLLHPPIAVENRSGPQPMDHQSPNQAAQHNPAFRNAFHGHFPATNHGDFHQHQQHQHQQQQHQHQQQRYAQNHTNHSSSSSSPHRYSPAAILRSSSSSGPDDGTARLVPVSPATATAAAASVFGTFRPVVRDSIDSAMSTGGTDSETSDMAETTDLSETSDANNSLTSLDVGQTTPPAATAPVFNLPATSVTKTNVRS